MEKGQTKSHVLRLVIFESRILESCRLEDTFFYAFIDEHWRYRQTLLETYSKNILNDSSNMVYSNDGTKIPSWLAGNEWTWICFYEQTKITLFVDCSILKTCQVKWRRILKSYMKFSMFFRPLNLDFNWI